MEKSTPLCNGRESTIDKVQDSETTLLVSKKGDKNDLVDSEKTPQSCIDVAFELVATTAGTTSSNSLPESVRLLESQLQVERHRSDVLRQQVEGLRKSLQNSDAYFLMQQQALEDISAKQEKVNKLAKHIASNYGYPAYCFLRSSKVVSVLDLFCCGIYLHWSPTLTTSVYDMLLCSLYLH